MEVPPSSISIPMPVVLAFMFLVLASYFRYVSLRGKRSWDSAWNQVNPSLTASPPPATMMSRGCTGLITWLLGWAFLIGCLLLAADFALNFGRYTASLVASISAYFN